MPNIHYHQKTQCKYYQEFNANNAHFSENSTEAIVL